MFRADSVGTALSQNTKSRMEDVVVVNLLPNGGGLFAVLDGHNGRLAVDFVSDRLPRYVVNSIEASDMDIEGALVRAFQRTEEELLVRLTEQVDASPTSTYSESDPDFPVLTSGVVLCVILVYRDNIYCASVGDCRAVMSRNSQPVQLSIDHNISEPPERKRVQELLTREGYVKGLMVTRSLGNVSISTRLKVEGQIATPSLSSFPIVCDDSFVIIASDGLYEVVSNEVAISTVQRAMKRPSFSPQRVAQELVDKAVARGSCDNICVCVVMLQ